MNSDGRITPYPLRIDSETRAKIEALAKANGRSLNAQIVLMLDEWLSGSHVEESKPLNDEDVRRIVREELRFKDVLPNIDEMVTGQEARHMMLEMLGEEFKRLKDKIVK